MAWGLLNALAMNTRAMTLCIYACITLTLSPLLAASRRDDVTAGIAGIPLAVVSVHDQQSDVTTDELRGALATALAHQNGIHVVSQDHVAEVMAYHEASTDDAMTASALAHALSLMEQAKVHYLDFAANEAQAEINAALTEIRQSTLSLHDKGSVLRDALITASYIYGSGQSDAATPYLKETLALDPTYSCAAPQFPPKLRSVCDRVRHQLQSTPTGGVIVESDPKVADVSVNGIYKGVTPLQLEGLPAGDYSIRISGNRYRTIDQHIKIASGKTETLHTHLKWKQGQNKPAPTAVDSVEVSALIREGVRLIDLLRLQKVVLLDVDEESTGGLIRARMIDATTKASHRPVVVQFKLDKSNLPKDMTEMVRLLTAQAVMKRIDNPIAQLDPAGVGDPIVLGRRKHRRMSPLAWGVIGGVVVSGALAGILAAVLSGGSSGGGSTSGTGSVNVLLSK